jgi:hypothetical protein
VLSQRGVVGALGMKYGTRVGGADRLTGFLSGKSISDNVSNELMALIANPIRFRGSGGTTFGYPATILADICEVVLSARKAGTLQKQQEHIADRAEILVRGFARVGIIALVDEATGFQEIRAKDELHRLLALYLSEERLKWAKRFPDEFYRQLYRLRDWKWPNGVKRTPLVGRITNEIVYEKLPPGVLQELWARNPTMEGTGRRRWKHHQFLSEDIGQPDLRDHLLQLIAVMRVSRSWGEFEENFERAFPGPQGNFDFLPQSE